jgi:hypothetical protein
MVADFQKYAPNFKGPIPPEEFVRDVTKDLENVSTEKGHGGVK